MSQIGSPLMRPAICRLRLTICGTEALDQRRQHPLYFIRLTRKLTELFVFQVFKISSKQDVILGLTRRSTCYLQETTNPVDRTPA